MSKKPRRKKTAKIEEPKVQGGDLDLSFMTEEPTPPTETAVDENYLECIKCRKTVQVIGFHVDADGRIIFNLRCGHKRGFEWKAISEEDYVFKNFRFLKK